MIEKIVDFSSVIEDKAGNEKGVKVSVDMLSDEVMEAQVQILTEQANYKQQILFSRNSIKKIIDKISDWFNSKEVAKQIQKQTDK